MSAILAATPAVFVNGFDVGGNTAAVTDEIARMEPPGYNRPTVEGIDVTGIQATGFGLGFWIIRRGLGRTAAHTAEWPTFGVQMQFIAKSGGIGTAARSTRTTSTDLAVVQHRRRPDRAGVGGGGLSPRETNRLWSYRDLNADLGDTSTRTRCGGIPRFRDQDVAARYVNFPVRPFRTRVTNYSGKATYQATPTISSIAYGQAGRNHPAESAGPFRPDRPLGDDARSTTRQIRRWSNARGAGC